MSNGSIWERVRTSCDELRVRAHLGTREARDAWDRMHWERMHDELTKIAEELRLEAHLARMDAKEALGRIHIELPAWLGAAGEAADRAVGTMMQALESLLARRDQSEREATS